MRPLTFPALLVVLLLYLAPARADVVELLNGIRVNGEVVSQADGRVVIDATMGGGTARMRFPLGEVHAITIGGQRRVVNEKSAPQVSPRPAPPSPAEPQAKMERTAPAGRRPKRSPAEVAALIDRVGPTPPEWFDSVPLEYPKTLDLSWPDKAPGGWNARRNVGQYLFSVINENPHKWRSGIRFLHHLLTVHKDDRQKLAKVMDALGNRYFVLFSDYERAAFWYRQAEKRKPLGIHGVLHLAECYWRLGSKALAERELKKLDRYITPGQVKLLAEMGEVRRALRIADMLGRTRLAAAGYTAAGDACRRLGGYDRAIAYYEKVLAVPAEGKQRKHIQTMHARARASIEAIRVFDHLDLSRLPDGVHRGTATAYAGPLSVEVTVRDGRIERVEPTRHKDKQYFTSLTDTPRRIVERQGLKGIDAVTGATITSQAIINATAKALAGAMK